MSRSIERLLSSVILAVGIATGCGSATGLVFDGEGEGESVAFRLPDGIFLVRWVAEDAGATDHGCLFGLWIEQVDADIEAGPGDRIMYLPHKLAYRSLEAEARGEGIQDGLLLAAGSYRLRSEGNCAWRAEILPGGADPTLPPGGVQEQRG